MTENFYIDNMYCYFKLLYIYKKTYKERGRYKRFSNAHKAGGYLNSDRRMNFNWEIRGLVPDEHLQTKKFFQL